MGEFADYYLDESCQAYWPGDEDRCADPLVSSEKGKRIIMGFSKQAFKNANENGGGDGFPVIPAGIYQFNVEDCLLDTAESGSENFKLNLSICDHDEYDGQWVFIQQNIVKKNGQTNEIGLAQMNNWLNRLSDGRFDPDDFEEDESGEITNTDEVLARFIGTKFKGQHKSKTKDGYTNSEVKFKALLYNAYTNGEKSDVTDTNHDDEELDTSTKPEYSREPQPVESPENPIKSDEKDVKIGMEVIFLNESNQEEQGTITNFIEGQSGEGMVMIKPLTGEPRAVFQDKVFALPEEEDFVEEDLPLVKGSKVKALFRGDMYEGTVHEVDENNGTCKIKFLDTITNKLKLRPQKISDCSVIG